MIKSHFEWKKKKKIDWILMGHNKININKLRVENVLKTLHSHSLNYTKWYEFWVCLLFSKLNRLKRPPGSIFLYLLIDHLIGIKSTGRWTINWIHDSEYMYVLHSCMPKHIHWFYRITLLVRDRLKTQLKWDWTHVFSHTVAYICNFENRKWRQCEDDILFSFFFLFLWHMPPSFHTMQCVSSSLISNFPF